MAFKCLFRDAMSLNGWVFEICMCLHLTSSLQPTARASAARGQAGEKAGKGAGPEVPGGRKEEKRHRQGPWGAWGSRSWPSMPVTVLQRVYRKAVTVVVRGLQPHWSAFIPIVCICPWAFAPASPSAWTTFFFYFPNDKHFL